LAIVRLEVKFIRPYHVAAETLQNIAPNIVPNIVPKAVGVLAPAFLALSSRRLRHPIFICRKGCQQIDCPAMDAMDYPKTKSILSDRIFSARVHIVHVDSMECPKTKSILNPY
jgi:hypothetical protein